MTLTQEQAGTPRAPWLRRTEAPARTAARLICLAHAGAGASCFNGWLRLLPDWVELVKVQLPGREDNAALPAITDLKAVIGGLIPQIEGLLDRPLVVYGHCVGALIAFELARELRRRGHALPAAMFVASRISPQTRPAVFLSQLEEEDLVLELERMGAMSPVLRNPRWRGYYLPTLRADMTLTDTYAYEDEPPLGCPIHMFVGEDDRNREEAGWPDQTSRGFASHRVDGAHFFSPQGIATLVKILCETTAAQIGHAPAAA